jgi:hypothetical protein
MGCRSCAPFETPLPIRGAAEFEGVVERVRQAVADGVLQYDAYDPDLAFAGQPSFLSLDLGGPWPDVARYHFSCMSCGQLFRLAVETYHGTGGRWSAVRDTDA